MNRIQLVVAGVLLSFCAPVSAATFTVNSVGDESDLDLAGGFDGVCDVGVAPGIEECTLRAAIQEANATAALDNIEFNISGCPGDICVIELVSTSLLPDIINPVVIDGSTQPGNAAVCTSAIHDRPSYRVVLDGDLLGIGLRLELGSDGSTIRGLNVRNFFNALAIIRGNDSTIECNFVGTDETGMSNAGNFHNALILGCDASGNVIGGPDPGDGNLFSGNGVDGIQFNGDIPCGGPPDGNGVLGNYIGTAKDGVTPLSNLFSGISMFAGSGPDDNVIGAMPDGSMITSNVVSGNSGDGVFIADGVTGAVIVGNLIGVDRTGMVALANGFEAIAALEGPTAGPSNIQIGGTAAGEANVLSGNEGSGLFAEGELVTGIVVEGNFIGTDATGTVLIGNGFSGIDIQGSVGFTIGGTAPGAGNVIAGNLSAGVGVVGNTAAGIRIQGNSIFLNFELGIDLGDDEFLDGPTENDSGDGDTGPNLLQNKPEITSVVMAGPNLEITYSVPSAVLPLEIEFFLSADREEGSILLGTDTYTVAGSKTATVPAGPATAMSILSATATDPAGNTSEFGLFGLIFTDGFETEDTSRWTRDVP